MQAPPLGITPRKLHDEARANAIHEAVNRYLAAGMAIPVEWIEEYNELVHKVSEHSVFSNPVHDVERPPVPGDIWHSPADNAGNSICGQGGFCNIVPSYVNCPECRAILLQHETRGIWHFVEDDFSPICGADGDSLQLTGIRDDVNCFQCRRYIKEVYGDD